MPQNRKIIYKRPRARPRRKSMHERQFGPPPFDVIVTLGKPAVWLAGSAFIVNLSVLI